MGQVDWLILYLFKIPLANLLSEPHQDRHRLSTCAIMAYHPERNVAVGRVWTAGGGYNVTSGTGVLPHP